MIRLLKQRLLDQVLPLSCLLCRLPCAHPVSLCEACILLIPAPVDEYESSCSSYWQIIRSFSTYQSPVKELIQAGKFSDNVTALKTLGQLFAFSLSKQNIDADLVLIPVPLHKNRLLSRGYNQAYEIALPLAKQLGLTINNHCITRIEEAKTQHFLSKQQRSINAEEIFQIKGSVPKKVAVIDDVFTTGATMRSICSCLQLSGAELIEVWIIARTLKESSGILFGYDRKTKSQY